MPALITVPDKQFVVHQSAIDRQQNEIDIQGVIQLPVHDIAWKSIQHGD